eukprot:6175897-Pleurochrysis_carterae.AAC.5
MCGFLANVFGRERGGWYEGSDARSRSHRTRCGKRHACVTCALSGCARSPCAPMDGDGEARGLTHSSERIGRANEVSGPSRLDVARERLFNALVECCNARSNGHASRAAQRQLIQRVEATRVLDAWRQSVGSVSPLLGASRRSRAPPRASRVLRPRPSDSRRPAPSPPPSAAACAPRACGRRARRARARVAPSPPRDAPQRASRHAAASGRPWDARTPAPAAACPSPLCCRAAA